MTAYYNEIDPYAAQWLRNLIAADLIAPGDVDERSIKDVQPDDLAGYTQCHFFAGIGGWSLALRLAGWPDARPVWTGSCPCQPFSGAGRKSRQSDERHLWPDWARLIREHRPATIFGEQVDEAIAAGWIDDCFDGLEAEAYACASFVLPAFSVGAEQERQRIYWVADTERPRLSGPEREREGVCGIPFPPSTERRDYCIPAGLFDAGDPRTVLPPDALSRPVGVVRAFGNAIVPELAAEFIGAYMECAA